MLLICDASVVVRVFLSVVYEVFFFYFFLSVQHTQKDPFPPIYFLVCLMELLTRTEIFNSALASGGVK